MKSKQKRFIILCFQGLQTFNSFAETLKTKGLPAGTQAYKIVLGPTACITMFMFDRVIIFGSKICT